MRVIEELEAWGHPNITGTHHMTFAITKATTLTTRGDCIIAVNASKGALDLSAQFKALAKRTDAKMTVQFTIDDVEEVAIGWGSPQLTFTHHDDLVARKSRFTCHRTLMIRSNKAAIDLSRPLIHRLTNPRQQVTILLTIEV